jgi:branched-chain amino acid transport system substrate-binding protein
MYMRVRAFRLDLSRGGYRMLRKGSLALVLGAVVLAPTLVAPAASGATSALGVTSKTITIGFITSVTGALASSFSDAAGGAEARVAEQNAQGGIDGRKLKLIIKDDATNPGTNLTDAQELAGSVFGVIENSGVDFESDKPLNQMGVPEINLAPSTIYSNEFSFEPQTSYNAQDEPFFEWGYWAKFYKSLGVTKLAGVTYPQVASNVTDLMSTLTSAGIATCYQNTTAPLGGTDFTVQALAIKSDGCDGVYAPMADASNVALSTGLVDVGLTTKAVKPVYGTGYDQSVLSSPAASSALNGAYFGSLVNLTSPNAATKTMLTALKKYDTGYHGGLPSYGEWTSYGLVDLMIKGLQVAGKNPTRAGFVSNLRKVGSYDGNGLFPSSVSFKTFGTKAMVPKSACFYFLQLRSGHFVSTNGGKPWCGPPIAVPGT